MKSAAAFAAAAMCAAAAAAAAPSTGTLRVMSMFRNGMVLQSSAAGSKHARVWGEAAVGAAVSLCGAGPACAKAVAGADGGWAITLAVAPSGPHTLTLSAAGSSALSARDVHFGNVLVCSGQSNLEVSTHRQQHM